MLDVRDICSFADFFVLATADSQRQISAVAEAVEKLLKEGGERSLHREGSPDSGWVLLDYGNVIVHVLAPFERTFYDLEGMWSNARTVIRIQ